MGPIATVVYKRIATLITEKSDQPYSSTLFWIRCKLSFSLLHSAIMCIRGSSSSYHHPAGMIGEAIDLTCSEGRIVSSQYREQTLRFTYSISAIVTFILLFYCFIFSYLKIKVGVVHYSSCHRSHKWQFTSAMQPCFQGKWRTHCQA